MAIAFWLWVFFFLKTTFAPRANDEDKAANDEDKAANYETQRMMKTSNQRQSTSQLTLRISETSQLTL